MQQTPASHLILIQTSERRTYTDHFLIEVIDSHSGVSHSRSIHKTQYNNGRNFEISLSRTTVEKASAQIASYDIENRRLFSENQLLADRVREVLDRNQKLGDDIVNLGESLASLEESIISMSKVRAHHQTKLPKIGGHLLESLKGNSDFQEQIQQLSDVCRRRTEFMSLILSARKAHILHS
jgi:hypothetical protein